MQKEFYFTGTKKDTYPTKNTINLYYKEDKTTRPSTIALYVLFFAVVLLALAKLLIFDMLIVLNDKKVTYEKNQSYLENQLVYLKDYNEINDEYNRYSFSYLTEDEVVCDRLEVVAMLEETVFKQATADSVIVTENVVSLSYQGLNLEETASLVKALEEYEIVEKVDVNTASLNSSDEKDNLTTKMVITLVGEAGGAQ